MNRCFATLLALIFASIGISSPCVAEPGDWVRFTLAPERSDPSKIHATFRGENRRPGDNSWSTAFSPSDFVGLDARTFRGPGSRPLSFAIMREAGRLDCTGNGGNGIATGNCRFTADPAFTQLLINRGIGRPTDEQAFGLMAVDARRGVIDAVAAARYPTPTIDNLMALSALGIDGRYVADMARAGYRPPSIEKLIEFKAIGITPEWIKGFVGAGYANVSGDGLVQLRALGITPQYIEGFERAGYGKLSVGALLQLKALGITPEFARSAVDPGAAKPSVSELVQLKMFGRRR